MTESEKKAPSAAEDAAVAMMESAAQKQQLAEQHNRLWRWLKRLVVKPS